MEQRFDIDDERPTGKRPATAADNPGGENKRLRVGSLAEPLHLNLSWTNGTLSPTDLTLGSGFGSAAWTSSQWLDSYPGHSNPCANAASSDSWSVSPRPGTWAPFSEQTPQLSTPLPPLSSLGLFDLGYGNIIGQPGPLIQPLSVPILDGEMTVSAHQSMSGFDDSLSTPETHAVFTPSAALIPELASLAYTPETGYSVSPLVKTEEVVVDETAGPTPSPNFLGLEDVSNRVVETVDCCSVSMAQQKQHESTCENLLAVEGDQGKSPTETNHDVCFGVVSSNGCGLKR